VFAARVMNVQDFADFAFVIALANVAGALTSLGIPTYVARQLALTESDAAESKLLSPALLFYGLASGAGAIFVAANCMISAKHLQTSQVFLASILTVSISWQTMGNNILIGKRKYRAVAAVAVVAMLVTLGGVALGGFVSGTSGALLGAVLGAGSGAIWLLKSARLSYNHAHSTFGAPILKILRFSLPVWVTGFLSAITWTRFELLILKAHVSSRDFATYNVGLTLCSVVTLVPALMANFWMPNFASLHAKNMRAELATEFTRATIAYLAYAVVASLIMLYFYESISRIIFGVEYKVDQIVIYWLVAGALASIAGPAYSLIVASGKPWLAASYSAVSAVTAYSAWCVLIPRWGAEAAAAVKAASQTVGGLLALALAGNLLSQRGYFRGIIKIYLPACASIPALFFGNKYYGGTGYAGIAGATSAILAIAAVRFKDFGKAGENTQNSANRDCQSNKQ